MQIKPYTFTYHTTTFEVSKKGLNYTLIIETENKDGELPYTNVQEWSKDVFTQKELDALEEFAKANYKIMLLMGGI